MKKEFKFEEYVERFIKICQCLYYKVEKFKSKTTKKQEDGTAKELRLCNLCDLEIGVELHTLFKCQNNKIIELIYKYIPNYFLTPS